MGDDHVGTGDAVAQRRNRRCGIVGESPIHPQGRQPAAFTNGWRISLV